MIGAYPWKPKRYFGKPRHLGDGAKSKSRLSPTSKVQIRVQEKEEQRWVTAMEEQISRMRILSARGNRLSCGRDLRQRVRLQQHEISHESMLPERLLIEPN